MFTHQPSVTRMEGFSNFLATNLCTKVAQIFGDFWPILKISLFNLKRLYTFAQLMQIFWLLL